MYIAFSNDWLNNNSSLGLQGYCRSCMIYKEITFLITQSYMYNFPDKGHFLESRNINKAIY